MDALFHAIGRVLLWLDLDFWEVAAFVMAATFALVLYRLHRSEDDEFRFQDFFADDGTGRGSSRKLIGFGAFLVHTWVTMRQEVYGELTIEFAALYVLTWSGVYLLAPITSAVAERFFGVKVNMNGGGDGQGSGGGSPGEARGGALGGA